jgi:hypothetical protein
MVVKNSNVDSGRIKIIAAFDRSAPYFKTAFIANASLSLLTLALVGYFIGVNIYTSIYLILVSVLVSATFVMLIGFSRSFIRTMILLPSFFMPHNMIIFSGSVSEYFGSNFSYFVTLSFFYIWCMTLYEVLEIKRNSLFLHTAKNSLDKTGSNYYCKPEMSTNLLHLSPIKRSSGWIRVGIFGVFQKIVIGLLVLLLISSILFKEIGDGYLFSGFLLSIAGVLISIMGRPMLIALVVEQVAVFILEKELNSKE